MRSKLIRSPRLSALLVGICVLLFSLAMPPPLAAADRSRVKAFLDVTGFDVALDSIALSAKSAPGMIGLQADDFGITWTRMADAVFAPEVMEGMAVDILEQTLDDDVLNEAVEFYAGDLGQRLVAVENAAHSDDDADRDEKGDRILADLVRDGSGRVELFKRMSQAIGGAETATTAFQEIQLRFLLAASAAGVVELRADADDLRAMMKSKEGRLLRMIQQRSLASSAYTYRDISDADVAAYVEALETPAMRKVYQLLNAVQYEITANRFEALARRMADLQPQQDL